MVETKALSNSWFQFRCAPCRELARHRESGPTVDSIRHRVAALPLLVFLLLILLLLLLLVGLVVMRDQYVCTCLRANCNVLTVNASKHAAS
jgi:hypothetical protein